MYCVLRGAVDGNTQAYIHICRFTASMKAILPKQPFQHAFAQLVHFKSLLIKAYMLVMSCFHRVCLCSTPVPVLRVQARLWPLLVPAWRNSAALHSSSVTAVEPATTTPTPTASWICVALLWHLSAVLIRKFTGVTGTLTPLVSSLKGLEGK